MKWTYEDTLETYKLGWSIFTVDEGGCALMALDDPVNVALDHKIQITKEYMGQKRDRQAAKDCQKAAEQGNAICRKAIEFLIAEKSPDVQRFNLQKTW